MSDNTNQQGPAVARDTRYSQEIITFEGTLLYLRIDLGPDLESVLLCYEDGEPDTYDIGKLPGLQMARLFVDLMEHAGHKAERKP